MSDNLLAVGNSCDSVLNQTQNEQEQLIVDMLRMASFPHPWGSGFWFGTLWLLLFNRRHENQAKPMLFVVTRLLACG